MTFIFEITPDADEDKVWRQIPGTEDIHISSESGEEAVAALYSGNSNKPPSSDGLRKKPLLGNLRVPGSRADGGVIRGIISDRFLNTSFINAPMPSAMPVISENLNLLNSAEILRSAFRQQSGGTGYPHDKGKAESLRIVPHIRGSGYFLQNQNTGLYFNYRKECPSLSLKLFGEHFRETRLHNRSDYYT